MKKTVFFMFFLFTFFLGGCLLPTIEFDEEEATSKTDSVNKVEEKHDVEKSETNLDYVGCEIIEDDYHGKVFIAYFDFENVSNENKEFLYTYTVKAFQKGVEMETAIFTENDYYDNACKEIQPNTKIKVAKPFEYKDEESPIILEVYPWISFDDKKLMEIEIKPE